MYDEELQALFKAKITEFEDQHHEDDEEEEIEDERMFQLIGPS